MSSQSGNSNKRETQLTMRRNRYPHYLEHPASEILDSESGATQLDYNNHMNACTNQEPGYYSMPTKPQASNQAILGPTIHSAKLSSAQDDNRYSWPPEVVGMTLEPNSVNDWPKPNRPQSL